MTRLLLMLACLLAVPLPASAAPPAHAETGIVAARSRIEHHAAVPSRHLALARDYRPGEQLGYVEDPAGDHDEAAWARRTPAILRHLFPPQALEAGFPEPD